MGQEEMIIRCLNCGTKNRIPKERMQSRPVCGRCRAQLDEMIIRCLQCGTKNRMPEDRLHGRPRCGQCGAPLVNAGAQAPSAPLEIRDANFAGEVAQGAILIDCWAPWCGPCRLMEPIMKELASQYAGQAKIGKLNVDENPATASKYRISSIPTLLLFRDGELRDRLVGAQPQEEIEKHLKALL